MRRETVLAIGVCLAGCGAPMPSAQVASCERGDAPASGDSPAPSRDAPREAEGPTDRDGTLVRRGECETEWLPAGVVADLPPEEEEALASLVRAWLSGGHERPLIEHRRGILFVKSEDDEGAEPPYPTSSARASVRACGLSAIWLRASLRATFAMAASPDFDGVTCDENVCCIPGMEYVPNRAIALRRVTLDDAPAWAIESTWEIAEAALGDEHVRANRRYLAGELERHAGGACPGEPPGYR